LPPAAGWTFAMLKLPGLNCWISLLSPPVHDAVTARMTSREYRDGQTVYSVGEPAHELYVVRRGQVRLSNHTDDGTELLLGILQAGDCLGEHGVIDGLPRFSNAYTSGATELMVLPKPDFDELYHEHAEIARALNLILCYRFRLVFAATGDASGLQLPQRLARLLVRLGYLLGQPATNGSTLLPNICHEDLARMLGATRQSVSRALKGLEDGGRIRLSYRRIHIHNLDRLAEECKTHLSGDFVVPNQRASNT
jgi:CRP-like cAMP-binding protein